MLRYREIKKALFREIAGLKPGSRLPSRPELCRSLDTTRVTLDKAIKELEQEGYLKSRNGSGTYVIGMLDSADTAAKSWGVILPNVMDEIYPGLLRGAENVAQNYGINIIICNTDNDPNKQEQYVKRLVLSGVMGIIIVPIVSNDIRENFRLYNQLAETKIPFVFCNRSVEGISVPVVTSNDFYGGYIASKYLLRQGYRHIAFISELKYKTSIDRCQGYLSALIEHEIPVNRRLLLFGQEAGVRMNGYEEMNLLLDSREEVDAVFCFNDRIAQGCYRAIQEHDLKISDDIGVIAYDNTSLCEILSPRMSSVSYKNVEIGEKAAELLWKMNTHQSLSGFEYYLFQPSIVVRDSCRGPGALRQERKPENSEQEEKKKITEEREKIDEKQREIFGDHPAGGDTSSFK